MKINHVSHQFILTRNDIFDKKQIRKKYQIPIFLTLR